MKDFSFHVEVPCAIALCDHISSSQFYLNQSSQLDGYITKLVTNQFIGGSKSSFFLPFPISPLTSI